jgi:hypothetical protein
MKSVEVTIDMKRMGRFLQKRAAGTIAAQMNPLILTTKRPSENRQALLKNLRSLPNDRKSNLQAGQFTNIDSIEATCLEPERLDWATS